MIYIYEFKNRVMF